jgi:hypothetical protein
MTERQCSRLVRGMLLGPAIVALGALASACESRKDSAFFARFEGIAIGTPEKQVVELLGPPQWTSSEFHLSQPAGYERQYREAAESSSVRYISWHRDIDVTCTVGLDEAGRVAYKACGGT